MVIQSKGLGVRLLFFCSAELGPPAPASLLFAPCLFSAIQFRVPLAAADNAVPALG